MHDRHPFLCTLALTLPLAAALLAGCILGGEPVKDALFAALKLVVIR